MKFNLFKKKKEVESTDTVQPAKTVNPIVDFIQSTAVAIGICVVIYIFLATPNQIDGASMEPNFHNGEIVLTNKISQWLGDTPFGEATYLQYSRGDVIVFQKPGFKDFIKRIVAIEGDTIKLVKGKVYLNGEVLNEYYIEDTLETPPGDFLQEGIELTVPENNFFIMGDNRGNSHDSRYKDIGFVDRSWLKGKVILRYWPINKLTTVRAEKLN